MLSQRYCITTCSGQGVYKLIENTVDAFNKMKSHNYKCMSQLMKKETKDSANVVFEQNPEHSQWEYPGVTYSLKNVG